MRAGLPVCERLDELGIGSVRRIFFSSNSRCTTKRYSSAFWRQLLIMQYDKQRNDQPKERTKQNKQTHKNVKILNII